MTNPCPDKPWVAFLISILGLVTGFVLPIGCGMLLAKYTKVDKEDK